MLLFAGNLEELIKHGLRSLRDTLPSEVNLTSKVISVPIVISYHENKMLKMSSGEL